MYSVINPDGASGKFVLERQTIDNTTGAQFEFVINQKMRVWDKPNFRVRLKSGFFSTNSPTIKAFTIYSGPATEGRALFSSEHVNSGGPIYIPELVSYPGDDLVFRITDANGSVNASGTFDFCIEKVTRMDFPSTYTPLEEKYFSFAKLTRALATGQQLIVNPMFELVSDDLNSNVQYLRCPGGAMGASLIFSITGTTYLKLLTNSHTFPTLNLEGNAMTVTPPRICVRSATTEAGLYAAAWASFAVPNNGTGSSDGLQILTGLTAASTYLVEIIVVFPGASDNQSVASNPLYGPKSIAQVGKTEAPNFVDFFGFAGNAEMTVPTTTLARPAKYILILSDSILNGYLEDAVADPWISWTTIQGQTGLLPPNVDAHAWDKFGFVKTWCYLAFWTYCNGLGTPARPVFMNHSAPGRPQTEYGPNVKNFHSRRGYGNLYRPVKDTFMFRYEDYSDWTLASDPITAGAVTPAVVVYGSFANNLIQRYVECVVAVNEGIADASFLDGTNLMDLVGSTANVNGIPISVIKRLRTLWPSVKVLVVGPTFDETTVPLYSGTGKMTVWQKVKAAVGYPTPTAGYYAFNTGGADNSWGRLYDTVARTAQTTIPTDASNNSIHPTRTTHALMATDIAATISGLAP